MPSTRWSRLALVAVLVLAAAACRDDGASGPSTPSTSSSSTTTTAAETAELELRGDGLGVVELGAPPAQAIAAVSAVLGDPTRDAGWQPASGELGTCPGERVRGVAWDHLVLLFTDADTAVGTGEHLFAWRVTGAPPAVGTATGLGYQATVQDAEELYPGAVEHTEPEEPFPGFLTIHAEGGPITAFLDGGVITNLEAGVPCGE